MGLSARAPRISAAHRAGFPGENRRLVQPSSTDTGTPSTARRRGSASAGPMLMSERASSDPYGNLDRDSRRRSRSISTAKHRRGLKRNIVGKRASSTAAQSSKARLPRTGVCLAFQGEVIENGPLLRCFPSRSWPWPCIPAPLDQARPRTVRRELTRIDADLLAARHRVPSRLRHRRRGRRQVPAVNRSRPLAIRQRVSEDFPDAAPPAASPSASTKIKPRAGKPSSKVFGVDGPPVGLDEDGPVWPPLTRYSFKGLQPRVPGTSRHHPRQCRDLCLPERDVGDDVCQKPRLTKSSGNEIRCDCRHRWDRSSRVREWLLHHPRRRFRSAPTRAFPLTHRHRRMPRPAAKVRRWASRLGPRFQTDVDLAALRRATRPMPSRIVRIARRRRSATRSTWKSLRISSPVSSGRSVRQATRSTRDLERPTTRGPPNRF